MRRPGLEEQNGSGVGLQRQVAGESLRAGAGRARSTAGGVEVAREASAVGERARPSRARTAPDQDVPGNEARARLAGPLTNVAGNPYKLRDGTPRFQDHILANNFCDMLVGE